MCTGVGAGEYVQLVMNIDAVIESRINHSTFFKLFNIVLYTCNVIEYIFTYVPVNACVFVSRPYSS